MASRAAAAATSPSCSVGSWRAAWRLVAAAHAAAAAAAALHGWWASDTAWPALLARLIQIAGGGWAAAEGPPAALAAVLAPVDAAAAAAGDGATAVRRCTLAAGVAVVLLRGSQLLLGQWSRCLAFLLLAVPLYAAAAVDAPRLPLRMLLLGVAAAAWQLWRSSSTAWLAELLAPHLLLLATS